ncbi:MAG: hypothetical protein LUQ71_10480 [Methanoregula sp.]|nr:hypothetical protein [Methanoregula sp.]
MECLKPAKLSDAPIKEIRELEKKHGVTLVAYEKFHPYKKLKNAELEKLKTAEKETGALLIAYEA